MTTIETTVIIATPEKGMSLKALEAEFDLELKKAGQHLVAQTCQSMEAQMFEQTGARICGTSEDICTCWRVSAGSG